MENKPKIGCVVMAAGNARRFGENKLAAQLRGRSLILRALEAVPAEKFDKVVVVTQYPEVMRLAGEFHFAAIHNPHPDYGISHTIELGLTALRDCDGVLFQVSDQPLLRRESVAELVDRWRTRPEKIVALGHGGVRAIPASSLPGSFRSCWSCGRTTAATPLSGGTRRISSFWTSRRRSSATWIPPKPWRN